MERLHAEILVNNLLDELTRMRRTLPVRTVKRSLRTLLRKIYAQEIRVSYTEQQKSYLAAAAMRDGEPTIKICAPQVEEYRRYYLSLDVDLRSAKETFLDLMATVLLHELYHLEHHNVPRYRNGNQVSELRTEDDRVRNESECWWYTVEELLIPLRKEGRLKHIHPTGNEMAAIHFYNLANGDRTHPDWMRLIHETLIQH